MWTRGVLLLALLSMLFSGAHSVSAQEGFTILVSGTVKERASSEKLEGVSITIFQDGSAFDEIQTQRNGRYDVDLPGGHDYRIAFNLDGLSERVVEIVFGNAEVDPTEQGFRLPVDMTLFEIPEGFDPAILAKPIGRANYQSASATLEFDFAYTSRIQREIEMEFVRLSEAGDDGKVRKEFDEHMRKAEIEFGRERWSQSLSWLEKALALYPNDQRAIDLRNQAEENLARSEELAEEQAEVSRLMRAAKRSMKIDAWLTAQTDLESILEIRPDELEAQELLTEVLAEIAATEGGGDDSEAQEEAVAEERTGRNNRGGRENRDEQEPEVDLAAEAEQAEREKRKSFDGLIKLADRSFRKDEYTEAKIQYDRALEMYPDDVYAAEQAQICIDRIIYLTPEEAAAAAAAAGSDPAVDDRAYADVVRRADEAFDARSYLDAQALYTEASEMRPTERYPLSRLRRLEQLLNDAELDADISVTDHSARSAEDAAELAAADAARLEQEQVLAKAASEDQIMADLERDQQQRDEADALAHSRNYVQAMQNRKRDAAEDYYREALESELRARSINTREKAENTDRLMGIWTGNSHARRASVYDDLEASIISWNGDEISSDQPRRNRVVSVEVRTEAIAERAVDLTARGDAMIQDHELAIEAKYTGLSRMITRRSGYYKVFADTIDAEIKKMEAFHNDRRRASQESRMMNFEVVDRKQNKKLQLGRGERDRRLDRQREIEREVLRSQLSRDQQQLQSEVRSAAAVRDVEDKYSGQSLEPGQYQNVPRLDDIEMGITERSYEQGNALIIERTIRVGNKVTIYRKTIAKYGVYYFKNDRSISRDIWILETFEVAD
ncbi:MAG: hypothetical protein P8M07_03675 [Flavobacteriales bacterium]|nr:hypothetical protein [Flavobacteriales bacterium]